MKLDYQLIGKRIRHLRKQRHISQAKLSEMIDKSAPYISYVESGKKAASTETLIDIANALGITLDALLPEYLQHIKQPVPLELTTLLKGCSTYEQQIIIENAKQLRELLIENRSRHCEHCIKYINYTYDSE